MTLEELQTQPKLLTFGCPSCRDEGKLIQQYFSHAVSVTEDTTTIIVPEAIRCPFCRRMVDVDPSSVDSLREMAIEKLKDSISYWADRMAEADASPEDAFHAYETMIALLSELEELEDQSK